MGSVTSLACLTEQHAGQTQNFLHTWCNPLVTGQGNGGLCVHKLYPTLLNLDAEVTQSVSAGSQTYSMCRSNLHLCPLHDQFACQFHTKCRSPDQAGTSWGESSKPGLFLNFIPKVRMLRFSRHSRLKCRKSSFWEQKHCSWAFLRTGD